MERVIFSVSFSFALRTPFHNKPWASCLILFVTEFLQYNCTNNVFSWTSSLNNKAGMWQK